MSELSISNVIRVTVQGVQRSRTVKNVNEVALFTPEVPNNILESMYVIDPSDVATAYGSNSLTYKMALNVFAQNANLLSGRGALIVIPMKNAVNATATTFTTPTIADISNFQDVNNGSLTITENGNTLTATGLNFAAANNLKDVAEILQKSFPEVDISVVNSTIVFGSKVLGADGTLVVSSGTSGTDLTGEDYLNVSYGTSATGTASSGESLADAITRTIDKVSYTGVMCAKYMDNDEIEGAETVIAGNDLIFVNAWYSVNDITGICKGIKDASLNKIRCLVYTNGFESAKLMMAAYVGRAFSVNFEGSDVSQTMNLKTLVNVTPDLNISQTDYMNAKENGVDLYISYEGDPSTVSNGANVYFDVIYENMALKFYAQNGMYNALKTTGTKIPQTESGITVLKNALGQVFKQFVRNGVIAAGKWNSAQTFGDPEVFRANIADQGWYIYSMPIAEQSQAERERRVAPYIQGACKRAGAVHEADVLILVEE